MPSKQGSEKFHKRPIILILAVFAALSYAVVSLVAMQVEITQKSTELEELSERLEELKTENAQLERYANDNYKMDYIEDIAREELDFSYADEKIYYFVPSN